MREFRIDRPDLSSRIVAAIADEASGRSRGVLLTGARGSGRSTIACQALRSAARAPDATLLSDTWMTERELTRSAEESLRAGRPLIACVSDGAARRILEATRRRGGLTVIPVLPLSREEVSESLTELLEAPVSAELASEAWRLSGGSPALLHALVESGVESGAIIAEGETAHLIHPLPIDSHGIAALPILTALAPGTRDALERLALIEPAPMALAERIVGAPALAELADAGLLRATRRRGTRPETGWLPMRAIAERLRAEARADAAAETHRRVLSSPLPRATDPWQALGRSRSLLWWYERGSGGEPPVPPAAAVRAANRTHEWVLAADLASHALATSPDPLLLRERAFARRFLGDTGGAHEDLGLIVDRGEDAQARIGVADLLHYEHGDADDAVELLRSAAERSGSEPARRELLGALSSHLAYAGRFAECETAHRAFPQGSLRERGRADIAHTMIRSHRGQTVQALRRLYRYQLLPTGDAPSWFAEELQGALFVCLLQAHGPRRTITATGVLGSTETTPFVRFDEVSVLTARISVLLTQGRASEALHLALSVEASAEQDRSGLGAHALALGAEAAAYVGDDSRSRYLESRFRETPDRAAGILRPNSEAALCAAALVRGDAGAAERTRALASDLARQGLAGSALRVAQAGLRIADPGCAELVANLEAETTGEVCGVFSGHGEALHTGDPHALFEVAEHYLQLGFTLHAAETFCQVVSVAGRTAVTTLAAEASSRARLILGLTDRVRAPHLAVAGRARVELSRREREIALLVSQGASNRSIAQALVISVRTVEGHLGRIYAKLGVSGRRELAGYIRRGDAR